MYKYDYIIVGAGLSGATFANLMSRQGKRCLVIDKRDVPGGNVYCEVINSIPVHKYGAHIFHTSNPDVWKYVNSFVTFNRYTNSPIANYKGRIYNLPFNMNTFYQLWGLSTPEEVAEKLRKERQRVMHMLEKRGGDGLPQNLEEQARLLVGEEVYEILIKGYTQKQWGRPCSELPAFIINRLPVRMIYDNNYFDDLYQGIPDAKDGYNTLINRMLYDNDNCEVMLSVDFFDKSIDYWRNLAPTIVYTGSIDCLFDCQFGELSYRSLRFETERIETVNFQGNAIVNYTDIDVPYTRIIEHKHFCMFGNDVYKNPRTIISREFPVEWHSGIERFYPVNNKKNQRLYNMYKKMADDSGIIVTGRLGLYKYMDMDKTIEETMRLVDKLSR